MLTYISGAQSHTAAIPRKERVNAKTFTRLHQNPACFTPSIHNSRAADKACQAHRNFTKNCTYCYRDLHFVGLEMWRSRKHALQIFAGLLWSVSSLVMLISWCMSLTAPGCRGNPSTVGTVRSLDPCQRSPGLRLPVPPMPVLASHTPPSRAPSPQCLHLTQERLFPPTLPPSGLVGVLLQILVLQNLNKVKEDFLASWFFVFLRSLPTPPLQCLCFFG